MALPISFAGLSTGMPTDKLVDAILQAEGAPVQRMQDRQAINNKRASLVRTFRTNLMALKTSFSALSTTSFQNKAVSSSDSNNSYVTATASGASNGPYDVVVSKVATKARLVSTSSASSTTTSLYSGGEPAPTSVDYTLTNTNGTSATYTLSAANNTLAKLRDAINADSANSGVSASVVQVGSGGTEYKLVLNSTNTGLGTGATNDSLFLKSSAANALGLATTGSGSQSALADRAQNAEFTINGISLVRTSNTVTDAVEGLTLNLKAGSGGASTTLTVATDRSGVTGAMNDLVSKFNSLYKVYKDNSAQGGALAGDTTLRSILSKVRSFITGSPNGLNPSNAYKGGAELGLTSGRDGTLSLDSKTFQAALDQNPTAVEAVFARASTLFQEYASQVTSPGSGNLALVLETIDSQNLRLNSQISLLQSRLDRRKESLQTQFANLEAVIGKMQSAGQSLGSIS